MSCFAMFEIDRGASMADAKFHNTENLEDSYVEFGPVSDEYRFGAIDVEEWVPYISKDKKEWSIALAYEIDGTPVSPLDLMAQLKNKIKGIMEGKE